MRCVHCGNVIQETYCSECWNRLVIGTPLKTNKAMIDEAIENILEVLEDETRSLSSLDRMEVLNGVRDRIDALTEAAILDEP